MHRRARHLTGRAAGASFHFDARFIDSTDGTAIQTWSDLAGTNDLTQSTSGYRPVYKTNIFNGNPAIRFDGTDDFYSLTTGVDITGEFSAIIAYKQTNTNSPSFTFRTSVSGVPYTNYMFSGKMFTTTGAGTFSTTSISTNTFQIITTYTNSGNTTIALYANGVNAGGANAGSGISGSLDCLGRRDWDNPDAFLAGDVGAAIHIRGSLGGTLRKRFEHAIGFSYKLACS